MSNKETSDEIASLASQYMHHDDPNVKAMAASLLSQKEPDSDFWEKRANGLAGEQIALTAENVKLKGELQQANQRLAAVRAIVDKLNID